MSVILFFDGLHLFHLSKIRKIDLVFVLADPYYPREKIIRFDLSSKMAAVGAPGPHGTFVPIAIELIISTKNSFLPPTDITTRYKRLSQIFLQFKTPETYNFLVQNGRFLQKS